jgi:predicted O-methyltransferase YrrM
MEFKTVAMALDGVPLMSAGLGWRVYDHLVAAGSRDVLELGTAHGVSAAYMAAAVQSRGGRVTTVDHVVASGLRRPQPRDVIERAGLSEAVDLVLVEDSSYTWWLKDQIVARTDADGICHPAYDFAYIDGAHNWTIDGLAFYLVSRLLRPGGWLLLDDISWAYATAEPPFGPGQGPDDLRLSAAERQTPHMGLVFDLLIRPHPEFANFRIEDGDWGWAQKRGDGPRAVAGIAELTGAELTGAELTGAELTGAALTGAALTGAALTGAARTGAPPRV